MRSPDLSKHADAWIVPIKRDRPDWSPAWEASISCYLLRCSWAHPLWSWYAISGVHLRPIPGVVEPAHKEFPDASHEIMIYALDPKLNPDPDLYADGKQRWTFLTPADLIYQVPNLADDQCKALVQSMIVSIVDGEASPDQDFREWWKRKIDLTVQHMREGKHKPQ